MQEAGSLKLQSLTRKELEKEFAEPSDDFVRMMAVRVHGGRLTSAITNSFGKLLGSAISSLIRDIVNERLSSALKASNPGEEEDASQDSETEKGVSTTQEEISGFHIVQAIASRLVDPKRIILRDAKSNCAILLDDNNRKTIARLHFNGLTTKYLGMFSAKEETRYLLPELTNIYQFSSQIEARIRELDNSVAA